MAPVSQEKLRLLQTGMSHIARIWEEGGHDKWDWVLPTFAKIEKEFEHMSLGQLRRRLQGIYKRLAREKRALQNV